METTNNDVPVVPKCDQCGGSAHICEQPDSTCRFKALARDIFERLSASDAAIDNDRNLRRLAPLLRQIEDGAWQRLSEARTKRNEELTKRVGELEGALARVAMWTHMFGAELVPPRADTYGEGIRDAKGRVARIIGEATTASVGPRRFVEGDMVLLRKELCPSPSLKGVPLLVTSVEPDYNNGRGLVHWRGPGYSGATAPDLLTSAQDTSEGISVAGLMSAWGDLEHAAERYIKDFDGPGTAAERCEILKNAAVEYARQLAGLARREEAQTTRADALNVVATDLRDELRRWQLDCRTYEALARDAQAKLDAIRTDRATTIDRTDSASSDVQRWWLALEDEDDPSPFAFRDEADAYDESGVDGLVVGPLVLDPHFDARVELVTRIGRLRSLLKAVYAIEKDGAGPKTWDVIDAACGLRLAAIARGPGAIAAKNKLYDLVRQEIE